MPKDHRKTTERSPKRPPKDHRKGTKPPNDVKKSSGIMGKVANRPPKEYRIYNHIEIDLIIQ